MFLKNYEQTVNATIALLLKLKVKVTKSTIERALQAHPDYPSLLSINDVLNELNIKTAAINIDKERLQELPTPFIAHTTNQGGGFVTVTEIDTDKVTYYSAKNNYYSTQNLSVHEFNKIWVGNTLLAEKQENSGESN